MLSRWLGGLALRATRALVCFGGMAAALDIILIWTQTRTPPTHFGFGLWLLVGVASAPLGLLAAGFVVARSIVQATFGLLGLFFEFRPRFRRSDKPY
jgi:hypothetical protein